MRRLVTLLVGLLYGSTAGADPPRIAWVGLERGPLPPREAEQLEKLLIDELDGYDSFRLVDASGHALDARLLAAEAALVARLKDEGINLALEFKTPRALKKFDQAIDVFETRLIQLLDYELLHDTMLAKAEAQFQSGNKAAAKTTLKQLAALSPKRPPTAKTHQPGLVKLWNSAKEDLGEEGTIKVSCDGCAIQIDGQSLGAAPLLATRIPPGKHYLVARWTHGFSYEAVQVSPAGEAQITVERKGPSEESRLAMLSAIEKRSGLAEASQASARSAKLAQSEGTLIAAVKADAEGKRWLLFAHHDAKGDAVTLVKVPFDRTVEDERTSTAVKRAGALMFVDRKKGELALSADGVATPAEKLADLLYQGAGAPPPPPPPEIDPPPPPPPPIDDPPPPPPVTSAETSIIEEWWFWTIIGGAVVVATGVGVGVWAGTRDPTSTEFEVILP